MPRYHANTARYTGPVPPRYRPALHRATAAAYISGTVIATIACAAVAFAAYTSHRTIALPPMPTAMHHTHSDARFMYDMRAMFTVQN